MATLDKHPIRPLRRLSGSGLSIEPMYFPEKASAAFKAGEAVYLNGGYVAEFTATVDDGSTRFLGFAAEDARAGASDGLYRVGVWVPTNDIVFIGTLYHGTSASAVAAITDYGTLLPLYQDTSGNRCYLDKGDTADQIDCCRIVGIWADESLEEKIGDIYPRVMFIVESSARTFGI